MKRLLPLLLSLCLLFSFLPAAFAAEEEDPHPVSALCVAKPGESVFLDGKEFQLLCQQATGHDLENIVFSPLPARVGTLTHKGERVTADTSYYQHRSPQISQICFTPYVHLSRQFTGQEELSFTMTSEKDETVSGTLLFYVPEEAEDAPEAALGSRTTLAKVGEPVSLTDFFPFHTSYVDGSTVYGRNKVTSVTYELPSSSQGALWLDYDYSDARKVLPEEAMLPDQAPNFYGVSFVPANREAAEVHLRYTASFDKGKAMQGEITIHLVENREPSRPSPSAPGPSPARVSTQTTQVSLSEPLQKVCQSRKLGTLESVTFDTLPTAEEGTILTYRTPVTAGEAYPYDSLSFAPGEAFQEDITLRYVGTDSIGYSFSGELTLSYGYPSELRFQDLTGYEWAIPAVRFLERSDYLYGESLFRPGENATRMELIHALVEAAYQQEYRRGAAPSSAFTDLPEDEALSQMAAVAASHGLVLGDGENRLRPSDSITRQDALVILYRAMTDRRQLLPSPKDLSDFSDAGVLSPYAQEAAAVLYAKGVLQGDGSGKLNPLSPITRAEMACLIYRAFG